MATSLGSLQLDSNFMPSTPHVHKFRTEMCKNFELYGKCKYGDEVSINNTISLILNTNKIIKSGNLKYGHDISIE